MILIESDNRGEERLREDILDKYISGSVRGNLNFKTIPDLKVPKNTLSAKLLEGTPDKPRDIALICDIAYYREVIYILYLRKGLKAFEGDEEWRLMQITEFIIFDRAFVFVKDNLIFLNKCIAFLKEVERLYKRF